MIVPLSRYVGPGRTSSGIGSGRSQRSAHGCGSDTSIVWCIAADAAMKMTSRTSRTSSIGVTFSSEFVGSETAEERIRPREGFVPEYARHVAPGLLPHEARPTPGLGVDDAYRGATLRGAAQQPRIRLREDCNHFE